MDRDTLDVSARRAPAFSELAQLVHDFKGPLSLVALETQVLQMQLDDGDHVEMVNAATRVLLNIDYIDRMVHDLIDSCALAIGHFAVHRKPTDLSDVLKRVMLRMAVSRDRERVVLDTPGPVILAIDALRIERVVANLVHNAIVYSPDHAPILVVLETEHGSARVTIRDAGPGIAPEEIERVFDEYRRASTSYMHDGSGLGLYVSKQIIEAHGGRIGVESTVGVGSEFHFELPME